MQIHQLTKHSSNKRSRRVGRGGKRGKTAGRGTKGQKARAGRKLRPELRDTIKRLPKLRGHGKNRARTVNVSRVAPREVTLARLDAHTSAGETITPVVLLEKGLVRAHKGRVPSVKILGTGEVTKKISVEGCLITAGAKEKIEKAGGAVTI